MAERKLRKVWEGDIACAHCTQPNHVTVQKEIVEPATPAEFNLIISVDKGAKQETLG